jgi:hypothetical protein
LRSEEFALMAAIRCCLTAALVKPRLYHGVITGLSTSFVHSSKRFVAIFIFSSWVKSGLAKWLKIFGKMELLA